MKTYKSESITMPDAVDAVSSPTTVYVRENIVEQTREGEDGTVTYYTYDETAYTRQEWELKQRDDLMEDLIVALVDKGVLF